MKELKGLIKLVETAIDKGATTVEEVHKAIASEPLDLLSKIEGLKKPAEGIKNIQQQSIGAVYETIRVVNEEVAKIAKDLLEKEENSEK